MFMVEICVYILSIYQLSMIVPTLPGTQSGISSLSKYSHILTMSVANLLIHMKAAANILNRSKLQTSDQRNVH